MVATANFEAGTNAFSLIFTLFNLGGVIGGKVSQPAPVTNNSGGSIGEFASTNNPITAGFIPIAATFVGYPIRFNASVGTDEGGIYALILNTDGSVAIQGLNAQEIADGVEFTFTEDDLGAQMGISYVL